MEGISKRRWGGYGLEVEVEVGEIGKEDESGRGADQSHRNKQCLHVGVDFRGDKIYNTKFEFLLLRITILILFTYHCWEVIKTALIG